MLNATEFIYDGIYSANYGLKIASFNGKALEETQYIVPNIILGMSPKAKRYHYIDLSYNAPPTYDFSVVSETVIYDKLLQQILSWIDSRKGFKPLVFMQQGLDELTYHCIFTVKSLIYHAGHCVGLNLSATFDSRYAYGKPIKLVVFGDGTAKEVDLFNNSNIVDDYIYPLIEFETMDGKISIINTTDSDTREFKFDGLAENSTYKVDNELKKIEGDGNDLLSKFSKKWLRIRSGKNHLKITLDGSLTITCPRLYKIIF